MVQHASMSSSAEPFHTAVGEVVKHWQPWVRHNASCGKVQAVVEDGCYAATRKVFRSIILSPGKLHRSSQAHVAMLACRLPSRSAVACQSPGSCHKMHSISCSLHFSTGELTKYNSLKETLAELGVLCIILVKLASRLSRQGFTAMSAGVLNR